MENFNETDDEKVIENFFNSIESSFSKMEDDFFDSYSRVNLEFFKAHPDAKKPEYCYNTDSGFDFYSVEDDFVLKPMERKAVRTGLHFNIPNGYEIQVRPKSGLASKHGISIVNSPGTVDNGYTGEVLAVLINLSTEDYKVVKGSKIAQGVVCPVMCGKHVNILPLTEVPVKNRGDNGFGSTGL